MPNKRTREDAGPHDLRECEERLRFEMLLADLSARFINLPSDRVDAEIDAALVQVCGCLDLDLGVLWEWEGDAPGTLVLTHTYRPLAGPTAPERMRADQYFPWCVGQLVAGQSVIIPSVESAPPEAAVDLASWKHYGIKSITAFALSTCGGPPVGVLSFATMRSARDWSDRLIKRLMLIAQILSGAIVRKRTDQALQDSEDRLVLALEAAEAGPWRLEDRGGSFWVGSKIMDLFGLPPGDRLDMGRFIELVHPDDRKGVRAAMERSRRTRGVEVVEYRIVRPDGAVRWMLSRGRMFGHPADKPMRMTGITSDITERKKQEEAFRLADARIVAAIETAGLGFYEMDANWNVTFLDERIKALAGIPPGEETKGHNFWWSHIHPDDLGQLLAVTPEVVENGRDRLMIEYRYLHPTLGLRWFQHLVRVQSRDADGRSTRIVGVIQDITERRNSEDGLRAALDEVRKLRDRLQNENLYLQEQMRSESGHGAIVGESEPIRRMLAMAKKVAPAETAVLITGETGTGKELLALAIHDMSPRKGKALVKVNCAALPAPLIESELFGREKGAYTGAMTQQVGRFEIADGSTIFLDEIGDLPLDLQAKLLRVLQDGTFERLGSHRTLHTNVRVVAATNRNLAAMIGEGRFREDLFHRLNVFPIEVPPLRARTSDISLLVWKFVQEFNLKMGRSVESIPKACMERLRQYSWPGNVRELRNAIERAMIVNEGRSLKIELPSEAAPPSSPLSTLADVERQHILEVLKRTNWRISGKGGAADILGLVPTTLHSRMKKLGIARPKA